MRAATCLAGASLCMVMGAWAAQPGVPTNAAGEPVRNPDGTTRNYSRHELSATGVPAAKRERSAPARPSRGDGVLHDWGYAAFGWGIGLTGVVSAVNGRSTEVYLGGNGSYWQALAWDARKRQFDQVSVSEAMSAPIVRIALAKTAGGKQQIVVGLGDGTVKRYDQRSKRLASSKAGSCAARGGLTALATADFNVDGVDELVSLCADQTLVVEGNGYAGWSLAGVGGTEIAVGQMDDDAALEIATTSGRVVDSATRAVQWFYASGFGPHLQVGDIDGDGREELIASQSWGAVWAFDVERQLPKWSLATPQDIGAIRLADIDGDGTKELLVGDGQWGSIRAYDPLTLQLKGTMQNPEHGVTQIAVVDLDGDGKPELLWGAGASSSGPDYLYVVNWATKQIVWQNIDLTGPFIGPVIGDLDGDGEPEIVFASTMSESGYRSGRIIVIDGKTLKVRAISPGVADLIYAWTGIHDIQLRDLDGDGRLEIVVGTDYLYDGLIEAYSFWPDNRFTLRWRNATRPSGAPFMAIDVADVDGDGVPEVLGGVGWEHTGQQGTFIYAYDIVTGAEKWRTPFTIGGSATGIVLGDFDGDGVTEIVTSNGNDGWVFSGATRVAEAQIVGVAASSLTRQATSGLARIVVGRTDGKASVRAFDGAGYPEVQSVNFGTNARVDGITVADDATWWVGSAGVLRRFDGATKLFETAAYGATMGRQTAWLPGAPDKVFACGSAGCYRFPVSRR